jgi:hypothetical protein
MVMNEFSQVVKRIFVSTTSLDKEKEPAVSAVFDELPARWVRNGWQAEPMKHMSIDFASFWSTAELLKKELGVETVSKDDFHFMLGLSIIHFSAELLQFHCLGPPLHPT